MNKGITIAGNLVMDYIKTVSTYPQPGHLADIFDVQQAAGGCVPNTLIDLARMKGHIPLRAAGRIGDDEAGRYMLDTMRREGIDTAGISVSQKKKTSFSDAMSAVDTGERTFFHYRGANAEFSPAHIAARSLECDLFHIGYILLLDAFDAHDSEYGTVMARWLHDLQARGIRTSIDVVSGEAGLFQEKVIPALRYCDYAIMNEFEAGSVSGLPARREDGSLNVENICKTLEFMLRQGVKRRVIVHCPEAGFCLDAEAGLFIEPSFKLPKGYIKGSVGAGDAFCAGCLYAIYHDRDPKWMLRYAAAAAAANLSAPDSISGMKPYEELLHIMQTWETGRL
ncbi:MAG: carbohydrate kinase family protein [Clostridia bacterium]|nr:carbohydrate kinase family protein [Clostridia bacterium]